MPALRLQLAVLACGLAQATPALAQEPAAPSPAQAPPAIQGAASTAQGAASAAQGAASRAPAVASALSPSTVWIPSEKPSGNAANDRVWFTFYPARGASAAAPAPAVLLLHYLGTTKNAELQRYGRDLSEQGISAAVVTLPYHMQRAVQGEEPVRFYVSKDAGASARVFEQGIADASTVATWLSGQPIVDAQKLGIVGVSIGAIFTHVAMGRDSRLRAGVALLGGGDLPDIYTGLGARVFLHAQARKLTLPEREALRLVDPLTYAGRNREPGQARRVLMIQGARDSFIPPRDAEKLWEALGRPPIQWVDTNHAALLFATKSAGRTATAYLRSVWSGNFDAPIPRVRVATLQFGLITGLDALITPAIKLQALRLGTRDHMALAHIDVGLGTRGLFAGAAVTVTPFVDIGIGRRLGGDQWRPYASLHLTF